VVILFLDRKIDREPYTRIFLEKIQFSQSWSSKETDLKMVRLTKERHNQDGGILGQLVK
jgi:hypothetical protein